MSFTILIILLITAFFTAAFSSITGMGGGITLFSVMTFFMPLDLLLPIHGMTQLTSNSSRIVFFKKYLNYKIFTRFIIGAMLGVILATFAQKNIVVDKRIPMSIVAFLIFYTVFKPKKMPSFEVHMNGFLPVGFFVGLLAIYVGAIGPFLAVFYVRDDLTKEEVIANKALMQFSVHLLKIPAFMSLGFDYIANWYLWIPLSAISIFGAKWGVVLLSKINDQTFKLLFKSTLTLSGINILYKVVTGQI